MIIIRDGKKDINKTVILAAKVIKKGNVAVCPTDTVYGLLCDATNKKAVQKLFEIKKRKKNKPVPIFVKDIATAKKMAEINKNQEKLLRRYWPGKLTAILNFKKQNLKFKIYGVSNKTIALRIPDCKFINVLLKKTNKPLVGTSANISGKKESTKIKEVVRQFENQKLKPDLIIDAGKLKKSLPSTIIDLTSKEIKILRGGEIKIKCN